MNCITLISSPANRGIFQTKKFNFQAPFFSKNLVARQLVGVSESKNIDQRNRLFRFLKDQLFLFSQSALKVVKVAVTAADGITCLYF